VQWSFYNRTVKWLALLILAASQCACTTLANRRPNRKKRSGR
jgi:hypothetical protein